VNRLLVLVLIIVACIAGLGLYRGWFHLTTDGSEHNADMTISVDRDKIRGDEEKVEKSARNLESKTTEKIGAKSAPAERHHDEP
jgi:hypothetical protein